MTPFEGQTQFKGFLTYPLPWDIIVSAVFQNISGPTITANYAAANAQIAPSLVRNLAACRGAADMHVHGDGSADRSADDVRRSADAARSANGEALALSQRMRLQANLNIYNVFNGSASSSLNTNYGPLWLQPSLLQDGRMLQFSGSLTF